jgi:ABC-type polysaccharide/polyol phosphate transport system ATPase subunit
VSHDLGALPKVCEKAMWLDHGQIRGFGPAEEIVAAYREAMGAKAAA